VNQPLTIAEIRCFDCDTFIREDPWEGLDAYPGVDRVVSHGLCNECFDKRMAA
jgi:hypothetical protein